MFSLIDKVYWTPVCEGGGIIILKDTIEMATAAGRGEGKMTKSRKCDTMAQYFVQRTQKINCLPQSSHWS